MRVDNLVLDTSALLMVFEHRIDLQREALHLLPGARLVVPTPVIEEVARLAMEGGGATKRYAKMALSYLIRFDEHKIGGKGDDAVVQTARRLEKDGGRVAVATVDQGLRYRCRAKGWPVLTLKGHRPFLDGYVD